MESDYPAQGRRFGPEFVETQRARYGHRPPEQRQLTYDIAVDDEYAPWREWLDAQLVHLTPQQADSVAGKVWLDESFWTTLFELAAGAALRERGLAIAYEMNLDGLTPDWTVLDQAGEPTCIVEVHTDMPDPATFGQMRAWHGLVQRIKQIPVSVVLTLAPLDAPLAAPDPRMAKRIAKELRAQLLRPLWPSPPAFEASGFTFLAMGRREGGLMDSPLGMAACFEPPSSRAGLVSADRLLEKVREKVSKYQALARSRDIPLIVAVGSHKFTGVTLDTVDRALQGSEAPVITMQFDFGDTFIAPPTTVEWKPVEPWSMPRDLAALLWVDVAFPFSATVRENPDAASALPAELRQPLNG
jgi:hypothetical protein